MKRWIVVILIAWVSASRAQTYYNDAQLWFNLYIEKRVNKHLQLHLNQQDRWAKNISWFKLGYADVGVTWKFNSHVKVLLDYVLAQKRLNTDMFSSRHQFYTAVVLSQEVWRWKFSYRNMLQAQFNDPYTSKNGYIPYYHDRNKFVVRYEATERFWFYTAEELYLPLVSTWAKGFDRSRTFLGMFYNVNRSQQLELYFMYQAQLRTDNKWFKQTEDSNELLTHDFVYGIGYSFTF
jgi:hypothetical protein